MDSSEKESTLAEPKIHDEEISCLHENPNKSLNQNPEHFERSDEEIRPTLLMTENSLKREGYEELGDMEFALRSTPEQIRLFDTISEIRDADDTLKKVLSYHKEQEKPELTYDKSNVEEVKNVAEQVVTDLEEDLAQYFKFYGIIKEEPEEKDSRLFV